MGVNTRLRKLKNFVEGLNDHFFHTNQRVQQKLANLDIWLQQNNVRVTNLEQTTANHDANNLEALRGEVERIRVAVSLYQADENDLAELSGCITELTERVHAISAVQHQLVARVDTLRNAHPPYSMRVEKLEDQIQGLSTWTSATVDEQNRLDTQMKSHADAIERNRVQASYLDEQEQSLRGSVLTLIERVEKLENDTERVLSTATGDALRFKQLDVLLPTIHDRLLTLEAFRAEVRWRGVLETDAETDEGTEIADIEEYEERL